MDFTDLPQSPNIISYIKEMLRIEVKTHEPFDIELEIEVIIMKLKYIETVECRKKLSPEKIDADRKRYTMMLKNFLNMKAAMLNESAVRNVNSNDM